MHTSATFWYIHAKNGHYTSSPEMQCVSSARFWFNWNFVQNSLFYVEPSSLQKKCYSFATRHPEKGACSVAASVSGQIHTLIITTFRAEV
jgi:hypothetical protein